jgi:hypothetical protein
MAYTHAYMLKQNLRDIEMMARATNARLTDESYVMPWESDLVSRASTHLFSVHRRRKLKRDFGGVSRDYGFLDGGCGTFMGIGVKDPTKKACILERKLRKAQDKCARGKQKQCDKAARFQSELATISGGGLTPTAGTPLDAYYQQALQAQQIAATDASQTGGIEKYLPVLAVGAAGIVTIYAVSKLL